jgi:ribonuclease-3
MQSFEERIKYKFRNSLLLAEALTHPSLGHETHRRHFDNQRLEFLGDAVLQLIFTEHLYQLFPHYSEGQLTKLRARMVSRDGLQLHASKLALGDYLLMGKGEEMSGGRTRPSTLADAFEALMGAIYLDSGFESVRDFVLNLAAPDLENLRISPMDVNPKGQLQEILQSIAAVSPEYCVMSESGPEHDKRFVSCVKWQGIELGTGEGKSKKAAEMEAAIDALKKKIWLKAERELPGNNSPTTPENAQ